MWIGPNSATPSLSVAAAAAEPSAAASPAPEAAMITEQEARERALAMLAVLGIRHGGVRRVVRVRMDAREQARLRALGVELPIQDTWSVVVGRQAGSEDLLPAE